MFSGIRQCNLTTSNSNKNIVKLESQSENSSNQIVVTSCIVDYQLCPLTGPFIKHYSVLQINYYDAKEFVNGWIKLIENDIHEVFNIDEI